MWQIEFQLKRGCSFYLYYDSVYLKVFNTNYDIEVTWTLDPIKTQK